MSSEILPNPAQGLQEESIHPPAAAGRTQGEEADGDKEIMRWREQGQEGYGVNEMKKEEAVRRAGRWSARQGEEVAAGPTSAAGFCRTAEPA